LNEWNRQAVQQRWPLSRFLDTNGDGTGLIQVTGDYEGTTGVFYLKPTIGEDFYISRLIIGFEDSGKFTSEGYGSTPLNTGIEIYVTGDSSYVDLLNGQQVLKFADWGAYCYDFNYTEFLADNNFGAVRWTFSKMGTLLRLNGNLNQKFVIQVRNQDMSHLSGHTFLLQGHEQRWWP